MLSHSQWFSSAAVKKTSSLSPLALCLVLKLSVDSKLNLILFIVSLKVTHNLQIVAKYIVLHWITSHENIQGNEMADTVAKSARSVFITNMKLPPCELLSCFKVLSGGMAGYMGLL